MRVIKPSTVRHWAAKHPDAATSLGQWLKITLAAEWDNLQEVRQSFRHADGATVASGKTVTIFNIAGNKYRLIAAIHYNAGMIYTLRFMSHAEYSKNRWKGEL